LIPDTHANLPLPEWTQVIPNARLCKALIDRITAPALRLPRLPALLAHAFLPGLLDELGFKVEDMSGGYPPRASPATVPRFVGSPAMNVTTRSRAAQDCR